MPYYDHDGRELSGRNDPSARGEWIYTEDGGRVRSESSRRQEVVDAIAGNQRAIAQPGPRYDEASAVLWVFKTLLFTLPLKAIQLVLWSAGIGWRCGRWTYGACGQGLRSRGVRPWLGTTFSATQHELRTVTVGLVAYVVSGMPSAWIRCS